MHFSMCEQLIKISRETPGGATFEKVRILNWFGGAFKNLKRDEECCMWCGVIKVKLRVVF